MIIRVENVDDCKTCDNFLTLLIHDEKQYDETIDENFVVKDYFVNVIKNKDNILLLYKEGNNSIGYVFAKRVDDGYLLDGLYVDKSIIFEKYGTIENFHLHLNEVENNKKDSILKHKKYVYKI